MGTSSKAGRGMAFDGRIPTSQCRKAPETKGERRIPAILAKIPATMES